LVIRKKGKFSRQDAKIAKESVLRIFEYKNSQHRLLLAELGLSSADLAISIGSEAENSLPRRSRRGKIIEGRGNICLTEEMGKLYEKCR